MLNVVANILEPVSYLGALAVSTFKSTPILVSVLITFVLSTTAFAFKSIDKKLDKSVYDEHSKQQIRQEDRASEERKEILKKVDKIIEKI